MQTDDNLQAYPQMGTNHQFINTQNIYFWANISCKGTSAMSHFKLMPTKYNYHRHTLDRRKVGGEAGGSCSNTCGSNAGGGHAGRVAEGLGGGGSERVVV